MNAKHYRRECLEINIIPSAVNDSDLEDIVSRILNKTGIAVTELILRTVTILVTGDKLLSSLLEEKCQNKVRVSKRI